MTGDTSQTVTVSYAVVAPDSTYLGASDFGGTLPSGTVTLGPTQTSTEVPITIPNGIGAATSKTLEVQVSAAAPATVIAPTAQETIVNSTPTAGVAPVFGVEFANDPSLLPTQNGTSWTFNLGTLTQGGAFNSGTLSLAVLNLAGTGADDLAATIAASGDGGLPASASPSFANLPPGGMLNIADLAVDTTSPGAHSETFTITPFDTNATGYAATLPTETVTVTDTVVATTGPVLGDGGNTVFWTQGDTPTVITPALTVGDAGSTTLTGATVTISSGFLTGDQLNFTNQNGITGNYDAATGALTLSGPASVTDYQTALESVSFNSTSASPSEAGADSVRTITWQASDSAGNSNTVTSTVNVGEIYHLTAGPDTIHAGAGNDIIIAASNTLSTGDVIDGGGGTNEIVLQGAGVFNLGNPTTLSNIQTVVAEEGQAASLGFLAQNEVLTLRGGTSLTVMVNSNPSPNPTNPKPSTITVNGANNSDTIDLGPGSDVVTLGGSGETVNGGSGPDTFIVNQNTISATINGTGGQSLLEVTGGGPMTMGTQITDVPLVELFAASAAYNFTANATSPLTVKDLTTATNDTLTAGAAGQTLTGGGAGKVAFVGSAAGGDTFRNTSPLFNQDSIADFINSGNVIDVTDVNPTLASAIWTQNNSSSGTLAVSDGAHSATITLFGQFMASGFHTVSDGASPTPGTDVIYQPPTTTLLAAVHHT